MKFDCRREQRVEPRIRQQVEGGGEPAAQRPAGPVRRCDPADLTGHEPKPTAMECAAERDRDLVRAIPAQFQHRRLVASEIKRSRQAGRSAAGMHDEIAIAGRRTRRGEADTERAGKFGAGRLDVDQSHLGARKPAAQPGDQRTDDTRSHHGNTIGGRRPRVPHGIERGLHVGGEHRADRRHTIGYWHYCCGGHVEDALMGMERKYEAAPQFGRPGLDPADRCVAIFDRKRETATHEWRAHALKLARRNAPGQHQAFRAAANATVQRADPNLARSGLGKRLAPDFGASDVQIP